MNYSQQQFKATTDLKGAYTYNWRGMLEFGPYFDFAAEFNPFQTHNIAGGVLLEYNIIKNRGKRKFIPAIGISLGGQSGGAREGFDYSGTSDFKASGGVHGALKIFVDKRTPFTIMLGYKLLTPTSSFFFKPCLMISFFATGFSYYFDFY